MSEKILFRTKTKYVDPKYIVYVTVNLRSSSTKIVFRISRNISNLISDSIFIESI